MKYYYVSEPYYGLMKANSKPEAIALYEEIVADIGDKIDDNVKEIDRDRALVLFTQATVGGVDNPEKVVDIFRENKPTVLALDSTFE